MLSNHPDPLLRCYSTFINYNLIWPVDDDFDPQAFPAAEGVDFKNSETTVHVSLSSILDYLRVLNYTLHYAIASYLIGCERYFLVEHYKAVEVIENCFGGERRCIDILTPFGVDKTTLKSF